MLLRFISKKKFLEIKKLFPIFVFYYCEHLII